MDMIINDILPTELKKQSIHGHERKKKEWADINSGAWMHTILLMLFLRDYYACTACMYIMYI